MTMHTYQVDNYGIFISISQLEVFSVRYRGPAVPLLHH